MLICDEFIPFNWTRVTGDEIARQAVSWHTVNAETLRALLSLEHGVAEKPDEDPRIVQELQRLEGKIDLLLGLVSQFILKDQPLPAAAKCRIGGQGLEWTGDDSPDVGEVILVTLVLNPRYPCPVSLPASVTQVLAVPEGHQIKAEFLPMPEDVQDRLERFVFLHHRKQVAQSHKR